MHKTMQCEERKKKRMWNVWKRLKDVIWTRSRVYVYVVLTQNYVHVVNDPASKNAETMGRPRGLAESGWVDQKRYILKWVC